MPQGLRKPRAEYPMKWPVCLWAKARAYLDVPYFW
jgi:hypothetical protein